MRREANEGIVNDLRNGASGNDYIAAPVAAPFVLGVPLNNPALSGYSRAASKGGAGVERPAKL
jgi:hypothetical protein